MASCQPDRLEPLNEVTQDSLLSILHANRLYSYNTGTFECFRNGSNPNGLLLFLAYERYFLELLRISGAYWIGITEEGEINFEAFMPTLPDVLPISGNALGSGSGAVLRSKVVRQYNAQQITPKNRGNQTKIV
jgi:hypothetical protein